MNRILLAAALALACATTLTARTTAEQMDYIRRCYAQRIDMMNRQPLDDVTVDRLTVSYNDIVPAMGLCTVTDTYYWTDSENEDNPGREIPHLYFVTSQRTQAHGMYRYTHEYLYDIETGNPLFLFIVTQLGDDRSTRREYRFYFDERGDLMRQTPERFGTFDDGIVPPDVETDATDRPINLPALFTRHQSTFRTILDR